MDFGFVVLIQLKFLALLVFLWTGFSSLDGFLLLFFFWKAFISD
jgi:hypothetical protein